MVYCLDNNCFVVREDVDYGKGEVTVAYRIAVVYPQDFARMLIVELLQSSEEFEPEGFEDVDQLRGRSDEFDLVITNWGGSERAGYYVPGGSMLAKFVELMDEEGIEKPIIVATGGNPSPEDKSDFPQVRYWWLVAEERPSEKDVLDAIMAAINDSAEQT